MNTVVSARLCWRTWSGSDIFSATRLPSLLSRTLTTRLWLHPPQTSSSSPPPLHLHLRQQRRGMAGGKRFIQSQRDKETRDPIDTTTSFQKQQARYPSNQNRKAASAVWQDVTIRNQDGSTWIVQQQRRHEPGQHRKTSSLRNDGLPQRDESSSFRRRKLDASNTTTKRRWRDNDTTEPRRRFRPKSRQHQRDDDVYETRRRFRPKS